MNTNGKNARVEWKASSTADILGTFQPNRKPADDRWAAQYQRLIDLRAQFNEERREKSAEGAREDAVTNSGIADSGSDEFQRDLVLSGASAKQELVYELDQALRRIETGNYGVCEITGQPIPPDRLEEVPWTRYTEEAQSQLEKKGHWNHQHISCVGSARRNKR